jgi:putative transposase
MKYNKKIKLLTKKEQQLQFDLQSKMCNWLYNQLFQLVEQDYVNGNAKKFLFGRNLRNQVPTFKQQHPFLYKVHSSPLKNVALRLKDAYDRWLNPELDNEKPHIRSWKKKWFSLFYDEPNKGFQMLDSTTLQVSFGKLSDEEHQEQKKKDKSVKKQITITVELIEPLVLEETEVIKTLRITKDLDSYYAVFTIENKKEVELVKEQTYISFDPNHKNLAVGIDNEGRTYELQRVTSVLQYWDERIDQIKSKRDQCQKQSHLVITPHTEYWKPSPRWERLNRVVEKAYLKRREQIKLILYRYAHYFSRKYDTIIIGDYTPTVDVAEHDTMHRAMLNQTPIGQFRTILKWV